MSCVSLVCSLFVERLLPSRLTSMFTARASWDSHNPQNTTMWHLGAAGGPGGEVVMHDLRLPGAARVATLWQHSGRCAALSFEDPWLASSSADGSVALLNVEAALKAGWRGAPDQSSGARPHSSGAAL